MKRDTSSCIDTTIIIYSNPTSYTARFKLNVKIFWKTNFNYNSIKQIK